MGAGGELTFLLVWASGAGGTTNPSGVVTDSETSGMLYCVSVDDLILMPVPRAAVPESKTVPADGPKPVPARNPTISLSGFHAVNPPFALNAKTISDSTKPTIQLVWGESPFVAVRRTNSNRILSRSNGKSGAGGGGESGGGYEVFMISYTGPNFTPLSIDIEQLMNRYRFIANPERRKSTSMPLPVPVWSIWPHASPTGRRQANGFPSQNGRFIHVIGGTGGPSGAATGAMHDVLELETGKWSTRAPLLYGKNQTFEYNLRGGFGCDCDAGAACDPNRHSLWLVGRGAYVHRYDPGSDQWDKTLGQISGAPSDMANTFDPVRCVFYGFGSSGGPTALRYDPRTDSVQQLAPFPPTARFNCGSFAVFVRRSNHNHTPASTNTAAAAAASGDDKSASPLEDGSDLVIVFGGWVDQRKDGSDHLGASFSRDTIHVYHIASDRWFVSNARLDKGLYYHMMTTVSL